MTLFCLLSFSGCKVESVYLGVDSVDTQRDRPEVGIPGSTQKCLSADDNSNPVQGWFTSLRNPSNSSVTWDPIGKMCRLCDFLWLAAHCSSSIVLSRHHPPEAGRAVRPSHLCSVSVHLWSPTSNQNNCDITYLLHSYLHTVFPTLPWEHNTQRL